MIAHNLPTVWFKRSNGLHSSQVHQTAICAEGKIWAVTPEGLACYDGVGISVFGKLEGLECAGLRTVLIDDDDRIWIGSNTGLHQYKRIGARLEALQSYPIGVIDSIVQDRLGLWIGTPKGLYRLDNATGLLPCEHDMLQSAYIADGLVAENDTVWICGPDIGLWALVGTAWNHILAADRSEIGPIRKLAAGPEASCLVGGDDGITLFSSNGHADVTFVTSSPVTALHFTNGYIWAACGRSISRFEVSNASITPVDMIMPDSLVRHINRDEYGNIWVATDDRGLAKISCLRNSIECLENIDIGSIMAIKETERGLLLTGSDGMQLGDEPPVMKGQKIWDAWQDDEGILYVAAQSGLYCMVNPSLPMPHHHEHAVLAAPCRALHRNKQNLYVGSTRGLAVISTQGISEIVGDDGNPLGYVYSIFADRDEKIWVATLGAGLWCIDNGETSQFISDAISDSCNIYSLCQSENGCIYISHDNKISRLKPDGNFELVVETEKSVAAWSIIIGDDGSILAGSSSGLIQYESSNGAIIREVGTSKDENGWEFTTSRSLIKLSNGHLLCGTGNGLFKFKILNLDHIKTVPQAALSSVKWSGVVPDYVEDEAVVQPGRWRLSVSIFTAWMIDEADCQMRYRLLGFDKLWSEPASLGEIVYSSLPSGRYALEVEIRSPIAGLGPRIWVYEFRVLSNFKTIAGKSWRKFSDLVRFKFPHTGIKRKITARRNHEIEQALRERTLELRLLNDDLRKTRDRYEEEAHTDPLTGISNRRDFEKTLISVLESTANNGSHITVMMVDIDHFKLYNDAYGHAEGDRCLKRVALALCGEMGDETEMVARIGGEEFAILLPDTNSSRAGTVAERIVSSIRNLEIPHKTSEVANHVTVSVGVKSIEAGKAHSVGALMIACDVELYHAKTSGRNRWSLADIETERTEAG